MLLGTSSEYGELMSKLENSTAITRNRIKVFHLVSLNSTQMLSVKCQEFVGRVVQKLYL